MSTLLGRARIARAFVAAAFALVSAVVAAAPMPNASRPVSITAREQPIAAFLQDLFAAVDVPAVVSPGLGGSVNGTFTGPAEKVLRDVSRIYNLVPYFDGAVMHVVPANEMSRRTFAASPALAERALREVGELGLMDARHTLRRGGDGHLVAVGTRPFLDRIDEMLRATQTQQAAPSAPSSGADFRVFYLRYAWAQDVTTTIGGRQVVVPGVASILRSLVGTRGATPLGRELTLKPTQPSLKGQGLAGQGQSRTSTTPEDAARNASVDLLVAALQRTVPPTDAQPAPTTAVDGHQVRIEADSRLNAVIVRDLAERLPRYEQLIAALDVEPQSLEIEATIIDVNTDRLRELGINWRWNNDGREASFSGAVPTAGIGGIASVVLGSAGQFLARIRAMQSEGAARVVSSPQVVTLSDVEAVFDNSSTFFVRVAGREQVDLFNVSAGTSLRVTPHVFRDRDSTRIKLMVNVEDGNLTGRQVDQIPVIERSTINTQALITEGESLLIGGMVRETTSSSEDKVPGLGDIPVVGHAFKTTSKGSTRVERMFLITPRLAGTRAAPVQSTPSVQRVAAAAPAPVIAQAAVVAAPAAGSVASAPAQSAPAVAPAALAAPAVPARPAPTVPAAAAPAPAYTPAPTAVAPARRASIELDLNAPLPPARVATQP